MNKRVARSSPFFFTLKRGKRPERPPLETTLLFNVLKPLFQEKTESSVGRSGDDKRANI